MNTTVIEHVKGEELPPAWRTQFAHTANARVTVRIEEEGHAATPIEGFTTDDPAFGIWRDRDDLDDVAAYMRKLRAPRYQRDGSRNEPR